VDVSKADYEGMSEERVRAIHRTRWIKENEAVEAYEAGDFERAKYWQLSTLIDQVAAVSWQLKVFNDKIGAKNG
jgi:hypothetical protein